MTETGPADTRAPAGERPGWHRHAEALPVKLMASLIRENRDGAGEASLAAKQSDTDFGSGRIVADADEWGVCSSRVDSRCPSAQRRSQSGNDARRGGNFRCQLGDVPCLRQRKSSWQAARVWLWWWLLPICASAIVRARKRYLFAPTASPHWTGAQTCPEVSLNSRRCGGRAVRKRVGQRGLTIEENCLACLFDGWIVWIFQAR